MTAVSQVTALTEPLSAESPAFRRSTPLWLALQLLGVASDSRARDAIADRAAVADSAALEALSVWAGSLTPVVVPRPGEGLLLELGGSLRYFSGLAAIRERLEAELARRNLRGRLAVAPTPLAAAWLARCRSIEIVEPGRLAGAVGALPIAATAWPDDVQRLLGQMGLRSIADCLRLPRAGFARRVGRAWLEDLDRALGRLPDPQTARPLPRTLERTVEFSFETVDRQRFARALRDMAASCEQELRRCQAQIARVEIRFRHLRSADTRTRMRFVEPVHERDRILAPLLARIETLVLPRPAIALTLVTGPLQALRPERPALLPARDDEPVAAGSAAVPEFALVECLRGRYGAASVHGIGEVAEHRPERAWHPWVERPPAGIEAEPGGADRERPLWLLPRPEHWKSAQGKEAERIESGWWDGGEVRRDYHVVVGAAGEKLWLYRDCQTREWYLHGIFG